MLPVAIHGALCDGYLPESSYFIGHHQSRALLSVPSMPTVQCNGILCITIPQYRLQLYKTFNFQTPL